MKIDVGKEIRAIARERIGTVKPSNAIIPKKRRKAKHKEALGMTIFIGAAIILALAAGISDESQWRNYKLKYNCMAFATTEPRTAFSTSGDTIFINGTTTYRCNPGPKGEMITR